MTIKILPFNTKLIEPVNTDASIYPVRALLTTNGVQYATAVNNTGTTYADLFSINTHTYFPHLKGKLTWVYCNISFEALGGSANPIITFKLEAKNSDESTWVIQSAEETYQTTTGYIGQRLEGYLLITASTIDKYPFDIRLQFKSDAATVNEDVTMKLKNDSVIRIVGSRE